MQDRAHGLSGCLFKQWQTVGEQGVGLRSAHREKACTAAGSGNGYKRWSCRPLRVRILVLRICTCATLLRLENVPPKQELQRRAPSTIRSTKNWSVSSGQLFTSDDSPSGSSTTIPCISSSGVAQDPTMLVVLVSSPNSRLPYGVLPSSTDPHLHYSLAANIGCHG